jgi:hypothetical protein
MKYLIITIGLWFGYNGCINTTSSKLNARECRQMARSSDKSEVADMCSRMA